jgi:hypothetical protein
MGEPPQGCIQRKGTFRLQRKGYDPAQLNRLRAKYSLLNLKDVCLEEGARETHDSGRLFGFNLTEDHGAELSGLRE